MIILLPISTTSICGDTGSGSLPRSGTGRKNLPLRKSTLRHRLVVAAENADQSASTPLPTRPVLPPGELAFFVFQEGQNEREIPDGERVRDGRGSSHSNGPAPGGDWQDFGEAKLARTARRRVGNSRQ